MKFRRLIPVILELSGILEIEDLLVTFDIVKVLNSIDHVFSINTLKKLHFGKDFSSWIKKINNLVLLTKVPLLIILI